MESRFKSNKPKRREIGAVWERKTQSGDTYLRIKLVRGDEEYWFHAFKNDYKTGDGQPEFVIYEDKPDDAGTN